MTSSQASHRQVVCTSETIQMISGNGDNFGLWTFLGLTCFKTRKWESKISNYESQNVAHS